MRKHGRELFFFLPCLFFPSPLPFFFFFLLSLFAFFLMRTTQFTDYASLFFFTLFSTHLFHSHFSTSLTPLSFKSSHFYSSFPFSTPNSHPLCPFSPFPLHSSVKTLDIKSGLFVFLVTSDRSLNCQLASLSFLSGIQTSGVPTLFYRHNTIFPCELSHGFSVVIVS